MKTPKQRALARRQHAYSQMKVALLTVALAGLAWLLAGCVPMAVHPFYRAADLLYYPAFLGVWKDKPDGKQSWTFTPGEGKSYRLEIQSDDDQAVFVAHLFRLGSERFLDLYPVDSALADKLQKNPYGVALVPAHLFVRVRATDPALRMSCMGLEWLSQQLKADPKALAHVILSDGRVVLTAETEAMQAFIKQAVNKTNAWNEMYENGLVKAGGKPGDK